MILRTGSSKPEGPGASESSFSKASVRSPGPACAVRGAPAASRTAAVQTLKRTVRMIASLTESAQLSARRGALQGPRTGEGYTHRRRAPPRPILPSKQPSRTSMSETTVMKRRPGVRRMVGGLISRPILTSAVGVGLFAAALAVFVPNSLRPSSRAILAWDAGCLWFVVLVLHTMGDERAIDIERRAARQDEGRHFILGLVLTAAAASLSAVAAELTIAKNAHGFEKGMHVALAFSTVTL